MGCRAPSSLNSSSTITDNQRFKVLVIGSDDSGKTSLVNRYIKGTFVPSNNPDINKGDPTVGLKFCRLDRHYSIQIWDLPADSIPHYRTLVMSDADGLVFVLDGADPNSFQQLRDKLKMYFPDRGLSDNKSLDKNGKNQQSNTGLGMINEEDSVHGYKGDGKNEADAKKQDKCSPFPPQIPAIVFANKVDMVSVPSQTMLEGKIENLVSEFGFKKAFLGSASSNVGVTQAFETLLGYMIQRKCPPPKVESKDDLKRKNPTVEFDSADVPDPSNRDQEDKDLDN
ncbi:hypothetical protein AAMO2058_001060600 [Amorphochlora amoebiformis]